MPDALENRLIRRFVPFFEKADSMLDLLMLGLGLAFFVITIGYAVACDRL